MIFSPPPDAFVTSLPSSPLLCDADADADASALPLMPDMLIISADIAAPSFFFRADDARHYRQYHGHLPRHIRYHATTAVIA